MYCFYSPGLARWYNDPTPAQWVYHRLYCMSREVQKVKHPPAKGPEKTRRVKHY